MTPPPTDDARHTTDPAAGTNQWLLILGHAAKAFGAAVTTTAVPWHIMLALGGGPADLGLIEALEWLPWVLTLPVVWLLTRCRAKRRAVDPQPTNQPDADPGMGLEGRYRRRLILCQLAAAGALAGVASVAATTDVALAWLAAIALGVGCHTVVFETTMPNIVRESVATGSLGDVNVRLQNAETAAMFCGVASVAAALAHVPLGWLFAIDAASYLICATTLVALRFTSSAAHAPVAEHTSAATADSTDDGDQGGTPADAAAAPFVVLLVAAALSNAVIAGTSVLHWPLLAEHTSPSPMWNILITSVAGLFATLCVAGVLTLRATRRWQTVHAAPGLMAVGCASCAALGLAAGVATAGVIAGVIVCNVIIAVFASSIIITHLQTTRHGEALTQAVFGMRAISYSAACVGPLTIGLLADHWGIRTCCVVAGLAAATIICVLTLVLRPTVSQHIS